MKIKNKALVKHEIRNIWPVFIYFIGCMAIGLWMMATDLNETYTSYLQTGYREDWEIYFGRVLQRMGNMYIVFFGVGILLLLYLQFKDNKSLQISSFMKSLPYTNQEVYKVKLGCGFLTITLPFALGSIGVLGIRSNADEFLSYIEKISIVGSELKVLNSLSHIILYLLMAYGVILFLYLFGFWVQYLVNNNVVSLVISGLSLAAIPFIVASCGAYLQLMIDTKKNTDRMIEALVTTLCPLVYLDSDTKHYEMYDASDNSYVGILLQNNDFMLLKVVILAVLIGMLLIAIILCNKSYKAENQESFISVCWAETLFKIGVIVSAAGLGILVMVGIGDIYSVGQKILLHLVMAALGVMAYLIVNKICMIGKR